MLWLATVAIDIPTRAVMYEATNTVTVKTQSQLGFYPGNGRLNLLVDHGSPFSLSFFSLWCQLLDFASSPSLAEETPRSLMYGFRQA